MNPLTSMFSNFPVVTGGAWATELQKRGLPLGEPGDLWNLTRPEEVEAVARSYAQTGSRVVLTNTFRANRVAMAGLTETELAEINRQGVALARRGAGGSARVFGSIGPVGPRLDRGEVAPDAARAAFGEQAGSLADAGADALVLETFGDLEEARLAIRAAQTTGLPVVASFTFFAGERGDRTSTGATPERAAFIAREEGADAVGLNCGTGPEAAAELARRVRQVSPLPLWVKPNVGVPVIDGGGAVYPQRPEGFAAFGPEWVAAGAAFVGGCCGAGPDFVRQLAAACRAV